jgi:HEPN domain-containing protein
MKPETARWVDLAEGDHLTAVQLEQEARPSPRQICFIAQQCVEKYLKALLEKASRPCRARTTRATCSIELSM